MPSESKSLPPLWVCPRCGAKLVTPNMSHSCGNFELEALFVHSQPIVFQIYKHLERLVLACGPILVVPQKTRLVFQDRVRFIGVVPRKSYLQVHFWFLNHHDSPRFNKVEQYGPRIFVHYIYVYDENVFDEEFNGWIREAYEVGQQKHLREKLDEP